jgi:Domain of unknown function (DUF1844)
MAEKPPAFTVTDRRKFTSDGEIRETDSTAADTPAPQPAPPAAAAGEFGAHIADAVHPAPGQFGARAVEAAPGHVTDAVHPAPGQFGARAIEAVHPAPGQFSSNATDAVHPAPGQFGARTVAAAPAASSHVTDAVHPAPGQFGGRVVTMPSPAAAPVPQQQAPPPPAPPAAPPEDLQQTVEDAADEGEMLPEPTAAESAEQHAAYLETSQGLDEMIRQSNPGAQTMGPVTIEHVIQSIYLSAVVAMGAATEPGQKPRIDILGARQSIDMLTVLQDKTAGNLSDKEQRMLQNMLFELRMMFLEITNAIANQAQNPPTGIR